MIQSQSKVRLGLSIVAANSGILGNPSTNIVVAGLPLGCDELDSMCTEERKNSGPERLDADSNA